MRTIIVGVDSLLCFFVIGTQFAHLTHGVGAVCNHDEYHSHVFCKRDEQVAEIFALYAGVFLIELLYVDNSFENGADFVAKLLPDVVELFCVCDMG